MFSEDLWNEWVAHESENYTLISSPGLPVKRKYLKKGYLHLDSRLWFPTEKSKIKKIVSNPANVAKHSFSPFLKIVIKTPRYRYDENSRELSVDYKPRPICFASHIDSLIYGFYSYGLTKQYESYIHKEGISDCVLAYRTDLSLCNIDFAREVFEYVRAKGQCTAIALDIKGFFDNISHSELKEKWCRIIGLKELPEDQYKIFRSLTRYGFLYKNTLLRHLKVDLKSLTPKPKHLLDLIPGTTNGEKYQRLRDYNIIISSPNNYGIPQGSSISALMSNIFMLDYDKKLKDLSIKHNFLYRRYCDDILIVCETEIAEEIKTIAYEAIAAYPPMTIQKKKEEEIIFLPNRRGIIRGYNAKKLRAAQHIFNTPDEHRLYKNLQYLGFEFNGHDIYIRSSSLARYFGRMKARITKTVKMAYSPTGKGAKIFKRRLYHRYTHLGKRNFISYALRAASETYEVEGGVRQGMNAPSIKKQIARHFTILNKDLERKNNDRIAYKAKNHKLKKPKK